MHLRQPVSFRVCQPVKANKTLYSLRGINHSHGIEFTNVRLRVTIIFNLATDSNTTSGCKNVHGSSKVDAADVFKVHIDTVWRGCFQSGYQIFFAIQGLIINSVVEAKLFLDQFCFLRATTRSDNLAIVESFGKLANKTSNCTGCSTDEDRFTFEWA